MVITNKFQYALDNINVIFKIKIYIKNSDLNNNKIPNYQYIDEDGIINVVIDIKEWDDLWKEDKPLSSL